MINATQKLVRFGWHPRIHSQIGSVALGGFALCGSTLAIEAKGISATVYVSHHFEVRDRDQPVKHVLNGAIRVASVTGSLSGDTRVQRLRVYAGWNAISLAVTAPDLAGQFQANGPVLIEALYKWEASTHGYSVVNPGQNISSGTALWVKARTNAIVAISGAYPDPANRLLEAGGAYVGGVGFETWSPKLPAGSSTWMFDSQSKQWREDLAGDLASLSGPPLPVAPGEAIYIHTAAAAAQLEGPDPTLRVRYYHQDHLGSSSAITDSQGGINEQTAFYPGGNPRSQTKNPRLDEPYQFTQKERDQESRLQYFETRYLMDSLSRFASVDSEFLAPDMLSTNRLAAFFAQPQQMNPYAYVMNNPLRWVDPNGRAPGDPFKTANAAATDALLVANPQSITANREYGGLIYYDPTVKRYYATTPTTGTGSSFNPGAVAIPAGTRKVGDYHTHGDYTFMLQLPTLTTDGTGKPVISVNNVPFRGPKATDFYDSEHFSGTDKTGIASDATGVPGYKGYLGTPAGTFQQYDPANGQVSGLSSTKPAKDPVSCRAIYTGEFPGPIKVTCE